MSLDIVPRITCVEHPGAVRDVDRAILTLGGKEALRKTINSAGQTPIELTLSPEDRFSHPIVSRSITSGHSIVLRVKVKKSLLARHDGDLRKTLAAHCNSYTVVPCAVVNCFVRFREMADYQYNTLNSPFVSKIRSSLYSGDCESKYNLLKVNDAKNASVDAITQLTFSDSQPSATDFDMPPPPRFSRITVPFDYSYRQNPAVHAVTDDTGTTRLVNKSIVQRLFSKVVRWTDAAVPDESYVTKNLPVAKATAANPRLLEIIDLLRTKFEERPIWTRRALEEEALDEELRRMWASHVKFALPYVAFTWKSGPWRATYTKYGINPRKDKAYAKYQTEYFRISPRDEMEGKKPVRSVPLKDEGDSDERKPDADVPTHIFDGIHLPAGRSFQLCDITDPVLADLVQHGGLRDEPDEKDGWYKATTMSKIRRIIRLKLMALWNGQSIKQMDVAKVLEEASDDEAVAAAAAAAEQSADEDVDRARTKQEHGDSNEKAVLHAVSAVSQDGGEKLRELLGILQQDEGEGGPSFVDADEYEIFDEDEEDEEVDDNGDEG
ncbi:RNA polymerase III transcription factor IIIC subunit-domain-containing protein [Lipomyces kononenkoae]|uniref:RNA polymerase III transcription factor IIIC subunit-domain-containing protein n=1 Tax=Lipomyces kononenkoae TaxID=34357 RepID=A0ACC3ST71_LIPKO